MIIFLDFDGVLHPKHVPHGMFSLIDGFLELLDDFPLIQIVISSSWRSNMGLDAIQSMLGRHGYKVIGVTPSIKGQVPNDFYRLAEIVAWLDASGHQDNWLAIDDAEDEFPYGYPNLFLCDGLRGLDGAALQALQLRLREMKCLNV